MLKSDSVVQDSRVALVQAALTFLAVLCHLGGAQFMLRRFQSEAWPIMLQLMKHGTYQQQQSYVPISPGKSLTAWMARQYDKTPSQSALAAHARLHHAKVL